MCRFVRFSLAGLIQAPWRHLRSKCEVSRVEKALQPLSLTSLITQKTFSRIPSVQHLMCLMHAKSQTLFAATITLLCSTRGVCWIRKYATLSYGPGIFRTTSETWMFLSICCLQPFENMPRWLFPGKLLTNYSAAICGFQTRKLFRPKLSRGLNLALIVASIREFFFSHRLSMHYGSPNTSMIFIRLRLLRCHTLTGRAGKSGGCAK